MVVHDAAGGHAREPVGGVLGAVDEHHLVRREPRRHQLRRVPGVLPPAHLGRTESRLDVDLERQPPTDEGFRVDGQVHRVSEVSTRARAGEHGSTGADRVDGGREPPGAQRDGVGVKGDRDPRCGPCRRRGRARRRARRWSAAASSRCQTRCEASRGCRLIDALSTTRIRVSGGLRTSDRPQDVGQHLPRVPADDQHRDAVVERAVPQAGACPNACGLDHEVPGSAHRDVVENGAVPRRPRRRTRPQGAPRRLRSSTPGRPSPPGLVRLRPPRTRIVPATRSAHRGRRGRSQSPGGACSGP